jgi:eukaryotic-like serine/threonine-protein kinase
MGIAAEQQRVRFGDFELDLRTRELWNNKGQKVTLQEQPFQILAMLLERSGQLVTRDELTRKLWPAGRFVDFEHSLNKAVNRLREALEDSAGEPRLIETLPRRGYRLIAQLQPALPIVESAAKASPRRLGLFSLAAVLVSACLLSMWIWIRRETKQPDPEFQRLTFGRGMIRSARFAADGQSVVYGAAWDGKPSQLFWTKAGGVESRALGVEGEILAISSSGEMAVLLNQRFGIISSQGTLAVTSLTGNTLRKLLDNVQDADWSPDGSKLAITHYNEAGRCDLEFPQGKVLYETTGGTWLSHPRVSPRGDQIAFLEHPLADDDGGSLQIVDLAGNKKTLSARFYSIEGLAWDPNGNAVWFSGNELGLYGRRALYKVTTTGKQYLVRRESGNLTLRDASRSGRLALTRDTFRGEVFGRIDPDDKERELGWLDNSIAYDVSPDGRMIALSVQGEAADTGYAVYLRRTDGSPAVRLGDGIPTQFSSDGRWVLTRAAPPSAQLLLLPTEAGQPMTLTQDSLTHHDATLLPMESECSSKATNPDVRGAIGSKT